MASSIYVFIASVMHRVSITSITMILIIISTQKTQASIFATR